MKLSCGYNHFYAPERVASMAKATAYAIADIMEKHGIHTVVVHGNSGVSMGFAAMMYAHANFPATEWFDLVLVRKDNDNSHGDAIEGTSELGDFIILDDFVASGNTIRRIMDKTALLCAQRLCDTPKCHGVLVYSTDACGSVWLNNGQSLPIWSSYVHE